MTKPLQTAVNVVEVEGRLYKVKTTTGGHLTEPYTVIQRKMWKKRQMHWCDIREYDRYIRHQVLMAVKGKEPDVILPGAG